MHRLDTRTAADTPIERAEGPTLRHRHDSPSVDRWRRPGRVVALRGIVFQCDADDLISGLVIRPVQQLSRRLRRRDGGAPGQGMPLANHVGIRVRVGCPDGRLKTYVVEQLTGTPRQHFVNGLAWTPWTEFKARQRGGWDVTVPASAFQGVEVADLKLAIERLNNEVGRPFSGEICTAFVERVFGGLRMFEDVEVLDRLVPGSGPRIPEPAAPIFKPHANLSKRARQLLRVDDLTALHGDVDRARIAEGSGRTADAMQARDDAAGRLNRRRPTPGMVWFWFAAQVGRLWARER